MKLYVGCSLTQAPQAFQDAVESIKNALRERHEVFDFYGLSAGTPQDVYQHDVHGSVAECDVFVALCDLPALGLGYELGFAVESLGKPTLALAHKDAQVSRLVQGITHPKYRFARYEKPDEIPGLIEVFIKDMKLT